MRPAAIAAAEAALPRERPHVQLVDDRIVPWQPGPVGVGPAERPRIDDALAPWTSSGLQRDAGSGNGAPTGDAKSITASGKVLARSPLVHHQRVGPPTDLLRRAR